MKSQLNLLSVDNVDLLTMLQLWRGEEACADEVEAARDGLILLPAAIEITERETGKSIRRKQYELLGFEYPDAEEETRLPHGPVEIIESAELYGDGAWSTTGYVQRGDRVRFDSDCQPANVTCSTTDPVWRIRYIAGGGTCPLPIGGAMLALVFLNADQLDDPDPIRQKSIDRISGALAIHLH